MANTIITIDGPAASGKSTVARFLAEKLHAEFMDTGAMYRAVTLAAMQAGYNLADENELLKAIDATSFEFTCAGGKMLVKINGVDCTDRIRHEDVTANSRYAASAPRVRNRLVEMQRKIAAEDKGTTFVTEGRDQGTVAFPDAAFKFYLTADPAERARRRQTELSTKGRTVPLQQLERAIKQRDQSDQYRAVGPLKPARDAVVVETTDLAAEDVVKRLLSVIKKHAWQKNPDNMV